MRSAVDLEGYSYRVGLCSARSVLLSSRSVCAKGMRVTKDGWASLPSFVTIATGFISFDPSARSLQEQMKYHRSLWKRFGMLQIQQY